MQFYSEPFKLHSGQKWIIVWFFLSNNFDLRRLLFEIFQGHLFLNPWDKGFLTKKKPWAQSRKISKCLSDFEHKIFMREKKILETFVHKRIDMLQIVHYVQTDYESYSLGGRYDIRALQGVSIMFNYMLSSVDVCNPGIIHNTIRPAPVSYRPSRELSSNYGDAWADVKS